MGIIVNPYKLHVPQIASQITCLTIAEQEGPDGKQGAAFRSESIFFCLIFIPNAKELEHENDFFL